ncbi:type I-E CRISPR-associated protein Cse1/CasA [Aerococcus sp. UMB8608]|uniref:Type I-E CRISPR-associated protein Cse1/CasA n=1 Tax=Aerococcus sanguinicola TaxID=119206 RepID=A0A5N1GPS1_9LACT|nr:MULTISPECIES: type I-E CRISPR-associated protein Cse1/CasA [Aerococcus]KAA9302306.1 type I-E CRISPR-associated protein Cse1/CasA [Aerococcus sanguinicola]MDK6369061.1 type I-E CRISPR-associated protein Cse1/CasA [Aerococcus sp. UMB9870]MDK6678963.1 type I-E CRISPR-associated protein Cse1/CasA [Aerococcus sp. UMB8608]MDK6686554.1 type I-E CRISPR-associated protein Cse1/CasA [Aerococcus sp. UMB8623]MDK6939622.1 type I-E CRISPR-associated protein Cse1/CasA [Aerococcus sp. UMB8487]
MSRFNLIDEAWIKVLDLEDQNQEVSLKEVFQNAHLYQRLAGETETQNFAVLRILLSILQTAFDRFDLEGDLRPHYQDDWDAEDRNDVKKLYKKLRKDWHRLWENKELPKNIFSYLDHWYDRFYLFDEAYPFMQVAADEISEDKISKKKASSVSGKNINRLISESGNKPALFSPKYAAKKNKEILSESEVARWLITLQGYIGLSDKVIFGQDKYKASKGWLFDIGGIYLEGDNLLETLLLNCIAVHPYDKFWGKQQKPAWEFAPAENIEGYFTDFAPDNLAELYTLWSRAVYIDPETDLSQPFECQLVKLPDLRHTNQFLEPMTLWRHNDSGENKGRFTPRKHRPGQAIWRSFGLLALPDSDAEDEKQRQPGIIQWLNKLDETISDKVITLRAVSMQDDGNATSWVPVDEICDRLDIRSFVLIDVKESNWMPRINDTVDKTKKMVEVHFQYFLKDINQIRNIKRDDPKYYAFINQNIEEVYFRIDRPFRDWLLSLEMYESKNQKVQDWQDCLYDLINQQVSQIINEAGPRDYTGIVQDKEVMNIATVHNKFSRFLWKALKEE